MSDRWSEVEVKLSAKGVVVEDFVEWCIGYHPEKYVHVLSPDLYFKNGSNIVRHRWSEDGNGAGELTVKRRKSKVSSTDRVEVDLFFGKNTTQQDVSRFLELTGWKRIFTIIKEAHIFSFSQGTSVVIYDCWRVGKRPMPLRFIEVEVGKGTDADPEDDKHTLDTWLARVSDAWEVGKPVNESLYEIYSGKKYRMV